MKNHGSPDFEIDSISSKEQISISISLFFFLKYFSSFLLKINFLNFFYFFFCENLKDNFLFLFEFLNFFYFFLNIFFRLFLELRKTITIEVNL